MEGVFVPGNPENWSSATGCVLTMIAPIFLITQHTTSFPHRAATHTRNTIRVNHGSLQKTLNSEKGCVYTVNRSVAILERAIGTSPPTGV